MKAVKELQEVQATQSQSDRLRLARMMSDHEVGRNRLLRSFAVLLSKLPLLRSRTVRLICRMEGGQMWSASFRDLMRRHYDVEIGSYSYGSCLWPGGLPAGTLVGRFCSLADGIQVFRRNHPADRPSQHPFFYNTDCGLLEKDTIPSVTDFPLEVCHDAWIGANAIITPRCRRIGIGAVVGAGTVVTSDVADFAIVAGNPGRRIKQRFSDEVCAALLKCGWWEYDLTQLIPVLGLFLEDATIENAQRMREHLRNFSPSPR